METCIKDIRDWMLADRLMLNDDKTEFLIIDLCSAESGNHEQEPQSVWAHLSLSLTISNDIKLHSGNEFFFINSSQHTSKAKDINENKKLLFNVLKDPVEDQVINPEVLFTALLVEHNLPVVVAQHATKIFPMIFPDSKIAKYKCSYTKTATIVEYALEPESTKSMLSHIKVQNKPYTIMIDESNDIFCDKECAILVRYFDELQEKTVVAFLDIPVCNIGTAANIFKCVDLALVKHGLSWDNVAGFSPDNCNVITGVKEKIPEVYNVGCPSHLVNICCKAAYKELDSCVETLIIDIYFYLDKSSKRREDLKEFQEFVGVAEQSVKKHCPTRWLSLGKALKYLLTQFDALKSYFSSKSKNHKSRSIAARLNNPMTRVYITFLTTVIPHYDKFNLIFQQNASVLYQLKDAVESLLRSLAMKLVKPEHIRDLTSMKDLKIDDIGLQFDNVNLRIGQEAKRFRATLRTSDPPASA
ncbi:PREDICTED: zinc finger BED domain-containing protein 5-like [Priapulus caudatus]|uniref:Zinc finger BED domain-containing protein 5-like n=1 Tax=Priapulus caudatus TaxID=37621 RepID=A0ABM1ERG7_PRICU|nr:PREDICTED: zinc finger BED domain-containing protein 5-like [Priapulus caudatus]